MMLRRFLLALVPPALILILWQGAVTLFSLPPYLLPGPAQVVQALIRERAVIGAEALRTGGEVIAGFGLGAALGAALALAMAASDRLRDAIRPALFVSQTIPVFALAPLLTLWLGFGLAPKIAVTVLIVFFPVATAFLDGLASTPPAFLDLARTMGATPARTMLRLRVPAALPALATGLRLAAIYAPVGAVIGEWVGGARGLGALMLHANGRMKIDLVFASLLVLAVMTVLFFRLVDLACRRWCDAR